MKRNPEMYSMTAINVTAVVDFLQIKWHIGEPIVLHVLKVTELETNSNTARVNETCKCHQYFLLNAIHEIEYSHPVV